MENKTSIVSSVHYRCIEFCVCELLVPKLHIILPINISKRVGFCFSCLVKWVDRCVLPLECVFGKLE